MAKAMERVQNIQTGVTIILHHLRELPRRVPRLLQVNLLAQMMTMMMNLSLDPADTGDVFDISKGLGFSSKVLTINIVGKENTTSIRESMRIFQSHIILQLGLQSQYPKSLHTFHRWEMK